MKSRFVPAAAALILIAFAFLARSADADRGIGISIGKIEIEDRLSPGGGYALPMLSVINTGTEAGQYEVAITYAEGQSQKKPPSSWFGLQPQRFFLNGGQPQNVRLSLALPAKAPPGQYLAYIEAHPVQEGAGVPIGVAAATKVSFEVKPSSWLAAQRVRFNREIDENEPWSYLVPTALLAALLVMTLRRSIRLRLPFERKR
jgi:hypothetical protein